MLFYSFSKKEGEKTLPPSSPHGTAIDRQRYSHRQATIQPSTVDDGSNSAQRYKIEKPGKEIKSILSHGLLPSRIFFRKFAAV